MNQISAVPVLVGACLFVLTACATPSPSPDAADERGTETQHTSNEGAVESASSVLARFSSCDDVAAYVEPYIVGLVPSDANTVDEWGVYCDWETPEGVTDLSAIATVSVSIAPTGTDKVTTDEKSITGGGLLTLLSDPAIEAAGGIAYTQDTATGVAAVSVTLVEVPGLDIHISGGQFGDLPALDSPAALEVTKALLALE